jgi:hypothetical protein
MLREQCGKAGRFRRIRVRCVSFEELFEKHGLEHVAELHVDAEGMDGMIVRSFPFQRALPRTVIFEQVHLTRRDVALTLAVLRNFRYGFYWEDGDVIARL